MRKTIGKQSGLLVSLILVITTSLLITPDAQACTRILWNTNPDLIIVGRNEDYVTASHPTFVASPRGVKRWGTSDNTKRSRSISWTVKYGNVASYANNRFPNDGMNFMVSDSQIDRIVGYHSWKVLCDISHFNYHITALAVLGT